MVRRHRGRKLGESVNPVICLVCDRRGQGFSARPATSDGQWFTVCGHCIVENPYRLLERAGEVLGWDMAVGTYEALLDGLDDVWQGR